MGFGVWGLCVRFTFLRFESLSAVMLFTCFDTHTRCAILLLPSARAVKCAGPAEISLMR